MFTPRSVFATSVLVLSLFASGGSAGAQQMESLIHQPYLLNTGLISRSISFENPTGAPGEGGKAASPLGVGRKGSPCRELKPGETVQLCDIEGPGTIRHIWITSVAEPSNLRSLVIRGVWDNQKHLSIECPIGDFFGFAHGYYTGYQSAVHSVGPVAGMNIWQPMPFLKRAKFTITNDGKTPVPFYYQITYTLGDRHPDDVGRLHVVFRRENPTTETKDFELLPLRKNKGRYLGTVLGVRNLHPTQWWGEGEFKVYMDGDTRFPTIAGTGSEDYLGLSWGVQVVQYLYHGCILNKDNFVSGYRWHLADPIAWQKEARLTIQQISWNTKALGETADDWSCATFWYEPLPSEPLPIMPDVKARTANIWPNSAPQK